MPQHQHSLSPPPPYQIVCVAKISRRRKRWKLQVFLPRLNFLCRPLTASNFCMSRKMSAALIILISFSFFPLLFSSCCCVPFPSQTNFWHQRKTFHLFALTAITLAAAIATCDAGRGCLVQQISIWYDLRRWLSGSGGIVANFCHTKCFSVSQKIFSTFKFYWEEWQKCDGN